MAVGARRRHIMLQFLIEAVTLSVIGGIIGIALGVGGSELIGYFAQWQTLVAPEAIALALSFAAGIGIFFGFYPPARPRAWIRSRRFDTNDLCALPRAVVFVVYGSADRPSTMRIFV